MSRSARWAESRAAYLFLLPWFAGLVAITAGPLLASLYLAFTDFHLLAPPRWNGLDNLRGMLGGDGRFWHAARNTLAYVALSVPLVTLSSLVIAVSLNRGLRGLAIYRSLFYIPSLLGGSVAIALLWRQVFGEDGIFNDFLGLLGIEGRSWIGNPQTALNTLVTLNVWAFGASMVIFLAALRQVPNELYEAARIDGARAVGRFRHITLPLITPVLFFNIVLQTIHSFQAFTAAHVISQGTGGPLDSTLLYTLYLYQVAFVQLNMGYAAAMAWLLLLAIATCTATYFWSARFWVFYDD
jgi:multiple sugar transport system permease protein